MLKKLATVSLLALSLTACGNPYSRKQNAVGGAVLGTGAGAVVGSMTGNDPLPSAILGGLLGAGAGYATTERRPYGGGYRPGRYYHRNSYGGDYAPVYRVPQGPVYYPRRWDRPPALMTGRYW